MLGELPPNKSLNVTFEPPPIFAAEKNRRRLKRTWAQALSVKI